MFYREKKGNFLARKVRVIERKGYLAEHIKCVSLSVLLSIQLGHLLDDVL